MKKILSVSTLSFACALALLAPKSNAALLQVKPLTTNQVQLTWQSSSNLSEELQHSPNLVSWQIVMRPYPAQVTNSTLTNVLAMALPKEFFRLQFSTLTNTPVPTTPGVYPGLKLVSGGLTRSYRLFVPPSYNPTNPAAPLAVILHGHGQTADGFAALHPDLFSNAASNGMILVLPDGTLRDSTTSWMDSAPRPYEADVHDTQFILDLVNVLKCALSVDNLRVYAGGFSNGGQMVHQLGIHTTNTFAALACVAAAIAGGQGSTNPVPPPGPAFEPYPVLIVNASNDCVRPYYGGINIEGNWQSSALSAAIFWVTNNGCTTNVVNYFATTSVATNGQIFRFQTDCYPPKAANTNSLVTNSAVLARFNGCGFGKVVEFVSLTDGGHNWPDANDNVGFDANATVIAFFLQHARTNYASPIWTGLQQFSVTSPIQNGGTFSAQLTLQNPGASIIPCGYLVWLNPNLNILKFTSWNTPTGSTVVTQSIPEPSSSDVAGTEYWLVWPRMRAMSSASGTGDWSPLFLLSAWPSTSA